MLPPNARIKEVTLSSYIQPPEKGEYLLATTEGTALTAAAVLLGHIPKEHREACAEGFMLAREVLRAEHKPLDTATTAGIYFTVP